MRNMDEMERAHALQAIRITFIYTMIFEVAYWVMECVHAKKFVTQGSVMFFLIITQGVVLMFSQFFLKGKAGDSKGFKGIMIALVLALIALGIGSLFMGLGV